LRQSSQGIGLSPESGLRECEGDKTVDCTVTERSGDAALVRSPARSAVGIKRQSQGSPKLGVMIGRVVLNGLDIELSQPLV
jgi:hypothetical protein